MPQIFLALIGFFCMLVIQLTRVDVSFRLMSILLTLGGIFAVSFGNRRGWVQQDHRYCGGCGYDLTGISSFPSTRCPECGADYATVGVQTWFRRPGRLPLIVLGCVMQSIPIGILMAMMVWVW